MRRTPVTATPAHDLPPGTPRGAERWWALAAVTGASFLLLLEDTAVSVALPDIRRDLGLGLTGLEWVVNAYTVALAVLMLAAGKLADVHGRRRAFLVGLAVFTLASPVAAVAGTGGVLLAARTVQGIGAAFTASAALSIVSAMFAGPERGAALGVWAGAAAVGLGLGPVVGAVLTQRFGWEAIFLINVPLGAAAWLVARAALVESRDAEADRRLPLGALLASSVSLLALLVALTEGNTLGWSSPAVLALLSLALACGALFARLERRAASPLVDAGLVRNRAFAGANVVSLLSTAVMCNLFFFLTLYFQLILGYTPLAAGASLLPLTGLIVLVAPIAGRLSDRIGRAVPVVAGMVVLGAALLLLSRLDVDSTLPTILLWLALGGLGIGLTTTPTTAAALDAASAQRAGVASGIVNTSRAVGLSLGIATMGAILSAGGADVLAGGGRSGAAFVDGLSTALTINAVLAFAAAGVAAWTLGERRRDRVRATKQMPSRGVAQPDPSSRGAR
jgi:EmrB/QacA subfamily drug resistance transporter